MMAGRFILACTLLGAGAVDLGFISYGLVPAWRTEQGGEARSARLYEPRFTAAGYLEDAPQAKNGQPKVASVIEASFEPGQNASSFPSGEDEKSASLGQDPESRLSTLGPQVAQSSDAFTAPQKVLTKSDARARSRVYFPDPGMHTLSQAAKAELEALAREFRAYRGAKILLRGRSDRTGDPHKNLVLRRSRASTTKTFLMTQGIEATRIVIDSDSTRYRKKGKRARESRSKLRRVDILFIQEDTP